MHVLESVYPSIYSSDHLFFREELRRVEEAGFRELHVDIQDGVFVPNLSFGMKVVSGLRKYTAMPFNVHLMVVNPEFYVERLKAVSGIRAVYFYPSSTRYPSQLITEIARMGAVAGFALNPIEEIAELAYYREAIGGFLVGTGEPDNAQGRFNSGALQKIRRLREMYGAGPEIVVDGDINAQTLPAARRAGATRFVVGRAIFGASDIGAVLSDLEAALVQ